MSNVYVNCNIASAEKGKPTWLEPMKNGYKTREIRVKSPRAVSHDK